MWRRRKDLCVCCRHQCLYVFVTCPVFRPRIAPLKPPRVSFNTPFLSSPIRERTKK
jgi:hypothetical protein